ncbi:MAG: ComF family protein [Fusobacterium sp.]|nr:ComF family protein [Fusobacterium sp.]
MKQFFINLLDWIYKKKCYFCRRSDECVKMCSKCYDSLEFLNYGKRLAIDGVSVYVAGVYEKNLQKLIRGLKYHNQRDLAFYQAKFMWEYWQNITDNKGYIVVPVPLHKNRQAKRRYNHMELVAQEFCRLSGNMLNTKLITRVKNTKPQYKLTQYERAQNLQNAFKVDKSAVNKYDKILILDDICTTGSTFAEMIKTLKEDGINDITCFATTTPKI